MAPETVRATERLSTGESERDVTTPVGTGAHTSPRRVVVVVDRAEHEQAHRHRRKQRSLAEGS